MNTPENTPDIVFASANAADNPLIFRFINEMGEFTRDAGFDGIEYHPLFHHWKTAHAVGEAHLKDEIDIYSVHQSFRTGYESRDTNRYAHDQKLPEKLLNGPAGVLIAPNMRESAEYMDTLQTKISARLPAVFYPQKDQSVDRLFLALARPKEKLLQPTDHVARLLGCISLDEMHRELSTRGYTGYALDVFHARRTCEAQGKQRLVSNIDTSLPHLATHSTALHLSLNRRDFAKEEPHIPTEQELRDALKGVYQGELLEMLNAVKEAGRLKYVAVEVTMGSLKKVTGHRWRKDLAKDYQDINAGLREFFAS